MLQDSDYKDQANQLEMEAISPFAAVAGGLLIG